MDDEVRKQIFDDFKKMITTESVVGEPIYLGDATIVPFVDISFGFGSGAHGGNTSGGSGGGTGETRGGGDRHRVVGAAAGHRQLEGGAGVPLPAGVTGV